MRIAADNVTPAPAARVHMSGVTITIVPSSTRRCAQALCTSAVHKQPRRARTANFCSSWARSLRHAVALFLSLSLCRCPCLCPSHSLPCDHSFPHPLAPSLLHTPSPPPPPLPLPLSSFSHKQEGAALLHARTRTRTRSFRPVLSQCTYVPLRRRVPTISGVLFILTLDATPNCPKWFAPKE